MSEHCNTNPRRCKEIDDDGLLALIKRQKAEIERLQKSLEEAVSCFNRMESLYKIKCKELEIAKSEARKEFAERLKEEMSCEDDCGYHCSDCYYECKDYVPVINNVLREMEK